MRLFFLGFLLIYSTNLLAVIDERIDEVKVYKSLHRMDILSAGKIIKSYKVMLGRGGKAPKQKANDNLVPEGQYEFDYKNINSKFHKSIHVSYPNDEDTRRAEDAGQNPGGDIMIHGLPNQPSPLLKFLKRLGLIKHIDWTAGCVALDDEEVDEIFDSIELHTPITIFH